MLKKNATSRKIEAKKKKAKEDYFIEQLSEEIVLHMIHVLQDHAVKMKDDKFLRDLAVIIEAIKALIFRDFNRKTQNAGNIRRTCHNKKTTRWQTGYRFRL